MYSDYCFYFIPEKVEVKTAFHVINYYKNDIILDSTNPDSFLSVSAIKPLFTVDLLRSEDEKEKGFIYSNNPK
jgi:hypothetical protein